MGPTGTALPQTPFPASRVPPPPRTRMVRLDEGLRASRVAGEVEPDDLGPPGRGFRQRAGQLRRQRAGHPQRREGPPRELDEFAPAETTPPLREHRYLLHGQPGIIRKI